MAEESKQICWWVGLGISKEGKESRMAAQGLGVVGEPGERHVLGREKECTGCLQSWMPVYYYRTCWPVFLCCLLSGTWHHRNPLGDPSCSSDLPPQCEEETGVSLPSSLSVHPSIIHLLSQYDLSNLSQTQPIDSAGSKYWPDLPTPGALTPVTDSPTSPSSFCSHPRSPMSRFLQ